MASWPDQVGLVLECSIKYQHRSFSFLETGKVVLMHYYVYVRNNRAMSMSDRGTHN